MFRKTVTAIIFLTILVSGTGTLFAQEDTSVDYNKRLVEMLEGYRELLSIELDQDVDDNPAVAWYIASLAIRDGFLRFTVDPISEGLLAGARFNALPGENVTHIIISEDLLDIWPEYPSTVYAVLTSAVQEAATFFQDPPAWGASRGDLMERLLIKVDGYATQAELIRDRLLPSGYLLSSYDTYVLDSYENDGLASVVLFLEGFSLPVAQGLYDIRIAYEENRDDDFLRSTVLDLGEGLLEKRDQVSSSAEDEEKYPLAVAIHSWLEFTPEMVARIHNRNRRGDPLAFDEILRREKDYDKLRRNLETSRTRDMPMIMDIAEDVAVKFGVPRR